ncbi:MAG TPA: nucleotidyl transferase AbiEii/AbiGii toxin family protein [Candidatus Babeliaceae bacterium]|nr:nucleotidyl transferase AbiEii/AbiGii toxin family protein [Candidatus Babeliaceae bacterium]
MIIPKVDTYVNYLYYGFMNYDPVKYVEFFHLVFLDQLGRKLDRRLYALKGGCNLRFFLRSIRYSQDIDLDVKTVRVETLQKTVNGILKSSGLALLLQGQSLELAQVSEAKQTETTQRWKVQLKGPAGNVFPTKIEFSRRGLEVPVGFETIDAQVLNAYRLRPIFVPHYGPESAFRQKISALASRTETQARDIWDLFHLIHAYGVKDKNNADLVKACENVHNISYNDFKDQVVAFFPEDLQSQYNRESWDTIQLKVLEYLESLK